MTSKREEIRTDIRRRAQAGEWMPGEQMPGVAEICQTYDCATATAVRAMHDLADEGVLNRFHGSGYYYRGREATTITTGDVLEALNEARSALERVDQLVRRLAPTPA